MTPRGCATRRAASERSVDAIGPSARPASRRRPAVDVEKAMSSGIRRHVFVLATLVAASVSHDAAAQGVLLPPSHDGQIGTGWTNVPFGRSTPTRAQFVYDGSMFGGPTWINAIDFRVDEGMTAASKTLDLEIRMSSLGNSVIFVQSTFASNRGADESIVFARKIFALPAAGSGASPNATDVAIPLDQAFLFDPVDDALVVEIIVHGQPPGTYVLDQAFVCTSAQQSYGPAGCGPDGGPILRADSLTSQATWGGPLTLRVFDTLPNTAAGFMFGFQESGLWNGIELPFDLSVIGATGCSLSIDAITTTTVNTDVTGAALTTLFLPSQPEIVGDWIRFQGIALDPTANALGVTTSQPFKIQVCGWEPVARVFSSGTSAAQGLREIGVAPVIRLR